MKCLSCGKPPSDNSVLCEQCSDELEADFTKILDRSSKDVIQAFQLEVSPKGALILVGDTSITYMSLTKSEWKTLKNFLVTKNWGDDEDTQA